MIKLSKIMFLITTLINVFTLSMENTETLEAEDFVNLKKYHMFCTQKIKTMVDRDFMGHPIIIGGLLEAYSSDKDSRMLILSDVDIQIISGQGFGVIVYRKKPISDILVKISFPDDKLFQKTFLGVSPSTLESLEVMITAKQNDVDLEDETQKLTIVGYCKIVFDSLGMGSSSSNRPEAMDGVGGLNGYSNDQFDYLVSKAASILNFQVKNKLKIKLCKFVLKPDIIEIRMLIEYAKYHNLTKIIVCLILSSSEKIIIKDKSMAILGLVIDSLGHPRVNMTFVNNVKTKLVDAIQHLSTCLDYDERIHFANSKKLRLEGYLDGLKKLAKRGSNWGEFIRKIETSGCEKAIILEFLIKGLHVLDFLEGKVNSIELPEGGTYLFELSFSDESETEPDDIEKLILEWLYDYGDVEAETREDQVIPDNIKELLLMNLIEFLGIKRAREIYSFQYLIARRFRGKSLQELCTRQKELIAEIDTMKKRISAKRCNKLYRKAEKYSAIEESTTSGYGPSLGGSGV